MLWSGHLQLYAVLSRARKPLCHHLPRENYQQTRPPPLSEVLALREQKKRREGGGSDPSWEDYKADRERGRVERKSNGVSSWLGFGKKEKDE